MQKFHKHLIKTDYHHNLQLSKKLTIKSEEFLNSLLIAIPCSSQMLFFSSFVKLCLIRLPIKSTGVTRSNFKIEL